MQTAARQLRIPAALAVGLALLSAPLPGLADEETHERARALVREGHFEAALDHYTDLLNRDPDDGDARLERSRLLGWLGHHEESLAELDRLLAHDPGRRDARVARARLLGWMGRYDEGEQEALRALATEPRDVVAHLVLGDLRAWQGQYAEALATYAEAGRLAPEDPQPILRIGRVFEWQGKPTSARSAYEEAIAIAPHALDPREALERLEARLREYRLWRIDAGFQYDQLSGGGASDWRHGYAMLSAPVAETVSVRAGFEQYRRFDESETQGTVGAFWSLPRGWSINAQATLGFDVKVVARYVVDAELARRLTERMTVRFRYQFSRFAMDINTNTISPGLEFWLSAHSRVLARYHLTHLTGNRLGHSGSLRMDLFPESPLGLYLIGSYGKQVFAPASVGGGRSQARVLSAAVGLQWIVRDHIGVRFGIEYEDLRNTYERVGLGTGVFVRF